jgi:hypothetical protein
MILPNLFLNVFLPFFLQVGFAYVYFSNNIGFMAFGIKEFWKFQCGENRVPVSLFQTIEYTFEDTAERMICYYFFNICLYKRGHLKR